MTTTELAGMIPEQYHNVALLLLSTIKSCQETQEPPKEPFEYEPELFADPKYYPEKNND